MQVGSYHSPQIPAWLKAVDGKFPFAFQAAYCRYIHEHKGDAMLFFHDPESRAILPVQVMARKLLTLGQIQFPPMREGEALPAEEEAAFWKRFLKLQKRRRDFHRLSQPPTWCVFASVPEGAKAIPFGSYRINLQEEEADIFARFQSRYRSYVRSAERKGAEIRYGFEELEALHGLHRKTMERAGAWVEPLTDLEELYDLVGESMALCAVVYLDGEPQGGLFVLHTTQGAYYLHGGSGDPKHNGLVKYLHWEVMKQMKAKGVKLYDFVGARLTPQEGRPYQGVQTFKARFGSELHEGFLWKMDLAPARCKAFDTALKVKLKLRGGKPFADIIDQEFPRIPQA